MEFGVWDLITAFFLVGLIGASLVQRPRIFRELVKIPFRVILGVVVLAVVLTYFYLQSQ